MKKLDKFILQSFIGPFVLTFLVVVFILLTQHMLKYFDDIIGKGLDWATIGQLLFYFAIFMIPIGMPLAVLLSSLITFGNLGEHFELTAIKASGVSLVRILRPIFFFVIFLTGIAFYTNNYLVPNAALEAYSLLYDIKQKKPALEIREGIFFNGIPNVSIKVNKKFPDGETLKDVLIYDHRKNEGNKEVTSADSGKMATFLNDQYLKLELFNGYYYSEGTSTEKDMTGEATSANNETMSRTYFDRSQVVFDLSSFQLNRTDQKWFQTDRIMRNMWELQLDIDSLNTKIMSQDLGYTSSKPGFFVYYQRHDTLTLSPELALFKIYKDTVSEIEKHNNMYFSLARDSTRKEEMDSNFVRRRIPTFKEFKELDYVKNKIVPSDNKKVRKNNTVVHDTAPALVAKTSFNIDSLLNTPVTRDHVQSANNYVRQTKSTITNVNEYLAEYTESRITFEIQWHKIMSNSLACIVMFLIGAPLGAIIKRGGLGVPFLVSILFFIIFYLLTMQGEKWAKTGAFSAGVGVWLANMVLLIIGMFFLRQARIDARLFETDFYSVVWDKLKTRLKKQ